MGMDGRVTTQTTTQKKRRCVALSSIRWQAQNWAQSTARCGDSGIERQTSSVSIQTAMTTAKTTSGYNGRAACDDSRSEITSSL